MNMMMAAKKLKPTAQPLISRSQPANRDRADLPGHLTSSSTGCLVEPDRIRPSLAVRPSPRSRPTGEASSVRDELPPNIGDAVPIIQMG
jgi:hypothetical protein